MRRPTYTLLLAGVLLLAMLPRLWLWLDHGTSGVVYPADEDEYYRGAIHILLNQDYYDTGQWLRPPLTSIFLAGVFAVAGVNIPLAMLVQAIISLLTLVLLAELAHLMSGSRRVALVAALLAGLFLPYASYASQMLSETLFTLLMAATLLLFEAARRRDLDPRWMLMCGLVWGLATLTRPIAFYALPLTVGLIWVGGAVVRRGLRQRWLPALPVRRRVWAGAALLAGFVLINTPWVIRNYAVHGHLILTDTSGGTSFWLGNLRTPEERNLQFEWNATIPNLADRQRLAMTRAIANIQADPALFISRTRNKAISLWQFDVRLFAANAPIGVTLDQGSLLFALASDLQYALLLLLAVVGIGLAHRHEQSLALLLWAVYGTLLSAVSLGHPRLRLPLMLFVFGYAALVLAQPRQLWARWQAAQMWRRAALIAGVVALLLIWFARIYIPFGHSQFWLLVGHLTRDLHAVERGIAAMPENYLPYVAQGDLLREQGDLRGALAAYTAAAERNPQNSYVRAWQIELARQLDDPATVQTALAALQQVSWDSNQLYQWAWAHLPACSVTHFASPDPAIGVLHGSYPATRDPTDGEPVRWAMGQMQLRVPQAGPLVLELRAQHTATPVQIWLDGQPVQILTLGPEWQVLELTVPRACALLELRAPTSVASVTEPYPRSVAWRVR